MPMLAGGRNRGPKIRSIVCVHANVNTYTLKSGGVGLNVLMCLDDCKASKVSMQGEWKRTK